MVPFIPSCRVKVGIPLQQPIVVPMVMQQLRSVSVWYVLRTTTDKIVTHVACHKTMKWGTTFVTVKETKFARQASLAVTAV